MKRVAVLFAFLLVLGIGIHVEKASAETITFPINMTVNQTKTINYPVVTGDVVVTYVRQPFANRSMRFNGGTTFLLGDNLNAVFSRTMTSNRSTLTYFSADANLIITDIKVNGVSLSVDNPPAVPTGLAGVIGVRSIDFNWNANTEDDFAGYNLFRNGVKQNEQLITGTSYTLNDVPPDVMYNYQLSAVDVNGHESNRSPGVTLAAMKEEIAPTLKAENITDTTLRLSWDNVAVSYEVYQDGEIIKNTQTKYVDVTKLQPNTNYEFYIVAIDKYGRKVNSNVVTVMTLPGRPAKPKLTVSELTYNSAIVSWTPDPNANNFTLYLDGQVITETIETSYSFSDLEADTRYQLKLVAHGDTIDNEISVSFTTLKLPVPTVNHATVSKHPTDENKRLLSYTASNGVTAVNVYLNGELVGTYPIEQQAIELDYSELSGLLAKLKVEPVEPDGIAYEFESPVQSSGLDYLDEILGKFLDMLGVQRNAFTYIALASIPLLIIVAIFFFLRPRFKKQVLDKDDNKPFGMVNQANPRAINAAQRKGFKIDTTRDERNVYQPRQPKQSRAQQLGFRVVDRKEQLIPVGFLGSGGYRKKVDLTYERNGVQYKRQYRKGQGMVFVPKDLKNQKAHVSNQIKAFTSAFGSNKKSNSQGGKRK